MAFDPASLMAMVANSLPSSFEPIFIAYGALIMMASIPIYFGSKFSIEEAKVFVPWARVPGVPLINDRPSLP